MKRFPHILHPISISLVLIFLTNSIGYAKESMNSNLASNCGEWRDESPNFVTNQGIDVNLAQEATGDDCHALFTLRNQIGHYSLFLNSTPNDANIQFLPSGEPILVPGLDIDVKTTPNNVGKVATIGLEGVINGKSATVDASLWLLRSVLELIPLPTGCSLPPPDQLLLLSFRLAPILENSVQLGIKGDFIGAKREFSRAINAYFDKAGDLGEGLAYDCVWSAAKLFIKKPVIAFKIATGYLSWLGTTLFDLYKYQGPAANTTVILSYVPTPTVAPPSVGGNLRQIGFLKDGNVWLINDDGSNQEEITNSGQVSEFRWSPDGQRIYYSRDDITDRIYIHDLGSRQESEIEIPRYDWPSAFDISPDGKTLILLLREDELNYSLSTLDLQTGGIEKITSLDGWFPAVKFLNTNDEIIIAECAQACSITTLNLRTLQSEEYSDLVFSETFDPFLAERSIAIEASAGFLGLVPCPETDPACTAPSGILKFDLDTREYSPLVLDDEMGVRVTAPDISADKNFLVFSTTSQIAIKDLITGEIIPLTPGRAPSWRPTAQLTTVSPSEKWIAFVDGNNISLIHPDGSGLKTITEISSSSNQDSLIRDYKWSPDGKTLAYATYANIYLYELQTSTTTLLEAGRSSGMDWSGFDWSPNGNQIIYATPFSEGCPFCNDGLWVYRIEDGRERQVIPPSTDITGLRSPQWSSEGSHVLFYIETIYDPWITPSGYGVANFETGKSLRLPVDISAGLSWKSCAWAPSDLIIACPIGRRDDETKEPELLLMDVSGNIFRRILLPEKMDSPIARWSPDGEKMAIGYVNEDQAWTDILTLDTEAIETFAPGLPSDWSPDGQWLLTSGGASNESPNITMVNTTSGQSVILSEGTGGVWQP